MRCSNQIERLSKRKEKSQSKLGELSEKKKESLKRIDSWFEDALKALSERRVALKQEIENVLKNVQFNLQREVEKISENLLSFRHILSSLEKIRNFLKTANSRSAVAKSLRLNKTHKELND